MNQIKKTFSNIGSYFKGVVYQAKKVRWPKYDDLARSSAVVIVFCAFFALFLFIANTVIINMFRVLGI